MHDADGACTRHEMCVSRWQRDLSGDGKLRVLVLAVERMFVSPFFTVPSTPPPPRARPSLTGRGAWVAALGPLRVHVPLETRRVGRDASFSSSFCNVSTAFVFFGLQTLCFPVFGAWSNFAYCFLDNLSFTTVLSGFEINSFDTANHGEPGMVRGYCSLARATVPSRHRRPGLLGEAALPPTRGLRPVGPGRCARVARARKPRGGGSPVTR